MKKMLSMLLLVFLATPALADETLTLRDHMRAMAYLLDEVYARSERAENYPELAVKTREIRSHLVVAISYTPGKIAAMNEEDKAANMIEFHQLMSRVIYLTATLERTFSAGEDFRPESNSRQDDIRNLLHEIGVIVGQAHAKFRD